MNDRILVRWERDFDIVIPPLVSNLKLGQTKGNVHERKVETMLKK